MAAAQEGQNKGVRPYFLATAATALADMLGNGQRLAEAADALRTAFQVPEDIGAKGQFI